MQEWLTTKELAEIAGTSQTRIRQVCSAGDLKATKRGRDWTISRQEAERWLAKRRKPRKKE